MKQIFVIRDEVAEEYGPIFSANNEEVAKRNFFAQMEKVLYPEDYLLYRLCYWNEEIGCVEHPERVLVARGVKNNIMPLTEVEK